MHLTHYTDYALRTLVFLAATGKPSTISEVAGRFNISRNHLVKVVHNLGKIGFIKTERGKTGGIRLAMLPEEISIGDVVRRMEPNFHLVECFCPEIDTCPITPVCDLKQILDRAFNNFMTELDRHTLADVLGEKDALLALLAKKQVVAAAEKN